jgi:hypothetical protein
MNRRVFRFVGANAFVAPLAAKLAPIALAAPAAASEATASLDATTVLAQAQRYHCFARTMVSPRQLPLPQ